MDITLERLTSDGESANETISLTQQKSYTFGRDLGNDIVLDHIRVSKNHCIIHHNFNGLFAEPLKNLNGFKINGKKQSPGSKIRLNHEDLIGFGSRIMFRVRIEPLAAIKQDINEDTNLEYGLEDNFGSTGSDSRFSEIEMSFGIGNCKIYEKTEIKDESSNFERVQESESETENKPRACSISEKKFMEEENLLAHLETHTGKKPYDCFICDKAFSHRSSLRHHMIIHNGENLHSCSICNKKCLRKIDLMRHYKVHTGEKPYDCSFCKKKFASGSYYRSHLKIHSGENPHLCLTCNKSFASNSDLIRHSRIHSGERPFACPICEKDFKRKHHLDLHSKLHSGVKNYHCPICQDGFMRKTSLQKHLRTHTIET